MQYERHIMIKKSAITLRSILRLLRLTHCILLTAICIPIIFSPFAQKIPQRRKLASRLYRNCYRVLNVKVIITGNPTTKPSLWVCNHISWLDILLLGGNHTVDFIAKSEVGEWPVIGRVVKKAGTLLIDRDNKFQAYRALSKLQRRIQSGTPVLVFPEGTTTEGNTTLPFKPMFYQAAIRENTLIQPISLQYFDEHGEISTAVPFIGDDDFSLSLKRILGESSITAHLNFLPPILATDYHRKALAHTNRADIEALIQRAA